VPFERAKWSEKEWPGVLARVAFVIVVVALVGWAPLEAVFRAHAQVVDGVTLYVFASMALPIWLRLAFPKLGGWATRGPGARAAETRRHGRELQTQGFRWLGSMRSWLGLPPFIGDQADIWALVDRNVFAWVDRRRLYLCSYFAPGPAIVLTGNYRGTVRKEPARWTQYAPGESVGALLSRHEALVQEFLAANGASGSTEYRAWPELTLAGMREAERTFDAGPGRWDLAEPALFALVFVLLFGSWPLISLLRGP